MSRSVKSKTRTGSRREELRRNLPRRPSLGAKALIQRPDFVSAGLILIALIVVASTVVAWSREQIKVRPGQIMTLTKLKRLDYEVSDPAATARKREDARQTSPWVYRINDVYLDELRAALTNLPKAVEGNTLPEEVGEEIVRSFELTQNGLQALQLMVVQGEPTRFWKHAVEKLIDDQLRRDPILAKEEYEAYLLKPRGRCKMLAPDGTLAPLVGAIELLPIDEALTNRAISEAVVNAGFQPDLVPLVHARLAHDQQPTARFNPEHTEWLANRAAQAVEEVTVQHRRNEILYSRGDVLSAAQLEAVLTEQRLYAESAPATETWLPRLGLAGLISILLLFTGGFVATSYPRIVRNVLRAVAIGVLMAGMLGLSALLTAEVPELLLPSAAMTTLFVAIILLLAYDQRLALFLSIVQCGLVSLAFAQGIGLFILLMAGCGTMIAQLREVRHRNSLIRAAIVTAGTLGVGTLLLGAIDSPNVPGIWAQIFGNAAWAVAASVVVGFLVLGILPSIERLFDITTGMTLAELRDASQPLLRQLQQRAPGTYNHSLQVATIAEAAADAIEADSLLVYVGALYHDIGKMNKPEYFVENQTGGYNRHAKLRPAMSLLVIIGHVKDGIELAREYGLPRSIQHFIESHHGTTLVEYFYHAAREEALADDKGRVAEFAFRYPGPRPLTKEAAILMLADAVESATRAMTEPNPSRIESLVRELSRKRLLDGQFDECDLTFRALGLIEEAMVARLCSIHHGRISYPSAARSEETPPSPRLRGEAG